VVSAGDAGDGKPWAADIHLTPDGKFLYASERTTSTLAAFRVDPKTGLLTSIDSYPTEKQPRLEYRSDRPLSAGRWPIVR
jgi:6-phosphogluconolactonase (cycloisomerase 2 family)